MSERWEHRSLEWIHRVREDHYADEAGKPLEEVEPQLSPAAAALARRLNLESVRASEVSLRRRKSA